MATSPQSSVVLHDLRSLQNPLFDNDINTEDARSTKTFFYLFIAPRCGVDVAAALYKTTSNVMYISQHHELRELFLVNYLFASASRGY